jgi:hypothetical protein
VGNNQVSDEDGQAGYSDSLLPERLSDQGTLPRETLNTDVVIILFLSLGFLISWKKSDLIEKLGANASVDKIEVVECEGDQVKQRPLENSKNLAVVKIGEQ